MRGCTPGSRTSRRSRRRRRRFRPSRPARSPGRCAALPPAGTAFGLNWYPVLRPPVSAGYSSRRPFRFDFSDRQGQIERVCRMDITWLGHACFRMRGRDVTVLTDPPDPKSGHAISKTDASVVTISHDHPGHASLKSVGGDPVILRSPGEYEVKECLLTGLASFHDGERGKTRGKNTVFIIRLDNVVVGHLGDLGHAIDEAELEALGDIDVLLVPVTGPDVNLTAALAADVVHQFEPKVVVPMSFDPAAKEGVHRRFLQEMGVKDVQPVPKLSVARANLPQELQVVVLESRARE
ncbi:MAG: MBL fold metallo-hydrolase [Chloroflexi bacterium]|nr:MAG: MBL fold metallo-hydrolase [Chloroflexota bacterium]